MLRYWLGFILGIIGWQYVAIRFPTAAIIRPSILIDSLTEWSKWMFGLLGKGFAHLSSIYVHLKLAELVRAIVELLAAVWHLLTSGFEVVVGYGAVAITYDHPYLIWLGSITLIGGLVYLIIRFFHLDMAWAIRHKYNLIIFAIQLGLVAAMGWVYWKDPQNWFGLAILLTMVILTTIIWTRRRFWSH